MIYPPCTLALVLKILDCLQTGSFRLAYVNSANTTNASVAEQSNKSSTKHRNTTGLHSRATKTAGRKASRDTQALERTRRCRSHPVPFRFVPVGRRAINRQKLRPAAMTSTGVRSAANGGLLHATSRLLGSLDVLYRLYATKTLQFPNRWMSRRLAHASCSGAPARPHRSVCKLRHLQTMGWGVVMELRRLRMLLGVPGTSSKETYVVCESTMSLEH